MEIEINGVRYRSKEQSKPKSKPMSKSLTSLVMMASSYAYLDSFNAKPQKDVYYPDIDIITEYGLIQNKKSKLSRSERDWVVWRFEKKFEKI